jgi:hypothetical protein
VVCSTFQKGIGRAKNVSVEVEAYVGAIAPFRLGPLRIGLTSLEADDSFYRLIPQRRHGTNMHGP